ncbi:MAG: DNA primase [Opitutales bacterium]|tara:strand:+ start:2130 stop:3965 length:1836 start_codon:yes stop_codon:yes gene_type:complete
MPLIQRRCIEEIRERVQLVDVASTYVSMKRAGSQWRGLSPFSQEKTPSFFIHPEKNVFKCYSSGHAGDLFRFIELKENLNFTEAVEFLAKQYSITLEYEAGSDSGETMSLRKELFAIHEAAASYFHQVLLGDAPQANMTREYWEDKRSFSLEVAKTYQIGLAPGKPEALLKHLLAKNFSVEALRESGLFYANKQQADSARMKPRFRGRLMIPIRDVQGRIIAFTARTLEGITPKDDPTREAKYVNSPETSIFSKSHVLFGLDTARKHVDEDNPIILVEGQLDAIRCQTLGLKTAVAPQGTAITESQLILIRRYGSTVHCLLDGDSAGQKAAMRFLPLAFKAGLSPRFLVLPEGKDPDTFLQASGIEGFKALQNEALDGIEFSIKLLAPKGMSSSPETKKSAFETIFEYFQGSDSLTFAEINLKKAGNLLGIYEYTVDKELTRLRLEGSQQQPKTLNQEGVTQKSSTKLTSTEYQLLCVLLVHEELAQAIAHHVHAEWIDTNTTPGELLNRFLGDIREDLWHGTQAIDEHLETDEQRNLVYSILAENKPFENPLRTANLCLEALFKAHIERQKQKLSQQLAQTPANERTTIQAIQQQRIELRNQLKHTPSIS